MKKLLMDARFVVVMLVLAGFGAGWVANQVYTPPYEVTVTESACSPVTEPEVTVSCPSVSDNITEIKKYLAEEYGDHWASSIQAAETDVVFRDSGGDVVVEDVSTVKTNGRSMQPTIFNGNYVLLSDYRGQDLEEGMIIRFRDADGSGYTVHRIRGDYEPDGFVVTQGDANSGFEEVELDRVTDIVVGTLYR